MNAGGLMDIFEVLVEAEKRAVIFLSNEKPGLSQ
jgi:hypothetical protein